MVGVDHETTLAELGLPDPAELARLCGEIADLVEPGYRVTAQRSCTGQYAKRWGAAFEAARLGHRGRDETRMVSARPRAAL